MLISLRQLILDTETDYTGQELLVACTNHFVLLEAKSKLLEMDLFNKTKSVTFEVTSDGYYQYIEAEDRFIKINTQGVVDKIQQTESMSKEDLEMLIEAYTVDGFLDIESLIEDYRSGGIDNLSKEIAVYLGKKFKIVEDGSSWGDDNVDQSANTEKEHQENLASQLQQVSQLMQQSAMSASSGRAEKDKNVKNLENKPKGNEWLR